MKCAFLVSSDRQAKALPAHPFEADVGRTAPGHLVGIDGAVVAREHGRPSSLRARGRELLA